jgi:Tfp pilus assembly protein PilV
VIERRGFMASREQLKAVAASCTKYQAEGFTSSAGAVDKSCENCVNFDGYKCTVNAFDKVLTGLDQG